MNVDGIGEVAERVRRYTVLVEPGGRGSGSGVVWTPDGTIVTNAHVARGPHLRVTLWDGRQFSAELVRRDPHRDLAALRIPTSGLAFGEPADSSRIRPGEVAIAIGNPLGFLGALTMGVIHCVAPVRGTGGRPWVQADVRLAPGNSGGPLADTRGRIIGINTMVAGRMALAIPSNEVTAFLNSESTEQKLGVTVTQVRLPRTAPSPIGLVLLELETGSAAARASLLPGDILLGTENANFSSPDDLAGVLQGNEPRVLRLRFLRGDYEKVRRVTVSLPVEGRSAMAA